MVVGFVSMELGGSSSRFVDIAFSWLMPNFPSHPGNGIQRFSEHLAVGAIGARDGNAEWNASCVDKQVALGA